MARVKCTTCLREQDVDGADCLSNGWPKCHGQTMRLMDGTWPDEQVNRDMATALAPVTAVAKSVERMLRS